LSTKPEYEIDKEDNSSWITIDPKDYSLNSVIKAASFFTETCDVLVDGNPEMGLVAELRPKNNEDLEELSKRFLDLLDGLKNNQNNKTNLLSEENFKKQIKSVNLKNLRKKSIDVFNELSRYTD